MVNFTFKTKSTSAALLLASGSVDRRGTYVFQVVPHEVRESESKNISYWSTGNGDDTMASIWNPADEAQDFKFTLRFESGNYILPIHLEARATRSFSIASLIRDQTPDELGHVIPVSVTSGSARLSGSHADNEAILVDLDAGSYNVRKATCWYYCVSCDGAINALIGEPVNFTTGHDSQLSALVQQDTGGTYNYSYQATWSSSSTSIATIASGGMANGVNHGAFTAYASLVDIPLDGQECAYNAACPDSGNMNTSGGGTVTDNTPIITGIFPSDWKSGAVTPNVNFTGQYFGTNAPTLIFSPSAGIGYSLVSSNDSTIVANASVASGTPNEDVSVSVTNNGYGGLGFQSGGGAVPAQSAPIYATVHSPLNSPEVTVIAWVNASAPDLVSLPGGENSTLQTSLNSSATSCALTVTEWAILGTPYLIYTSADATYANTWLVAHSANPAPPSVITPSVQFSAGNYRLFNDFGNGGGAYRVGSTPDPCNTGIIPGWVGAGQPSPYMGASGTSPSGEIYQVAEGRIGKVGQWGSQTINGGRTVPWIWSAIEFNSAGTAKYSMVGTFPTYSVYINGYLTATYPQSSVASFVLNNASYQLIPTSIP